jgi:hypothetical protein
MPDGQNFWQSSHEVQQYFLSTMKTVASSRFNAAKRLETRDKRMTWITATTSAYVIVLTVLPYIETLPSTVRNNLDFAVVFFSIMVLVSSLLHNSNRDAVNAEQHHRSALEINELWRELRQKPLVLDDLKNVLAKYNEVLQKYSINHEDIDYLKYQTTKPESFPPKSICEFWAIKSKLLLLENIHLITLGAVTIFMIWLVFFYAWPLRMTT